MTPMRRGACAPTNLPGRSAEGAATLLSVDGRSASDLRTAVTSKGGTTQAATEAFDARDVMEAIERGVVAARDRGRDLAEG